FKDEKFMSEESLYYYLADYGKFLPFKDQVYGYRYLEDGWTKNLFRIWEENPLSTLYSLKMRKKYIQKHVKGLKKTKELIKVSMNINSLEWLNEKSFKKYIKGKSIKQWFYVPIFFIFKKIRFERKK
ncbi:glycosyltransferase family 2 protein, partial [Enterococcus faecium]